MSQQANNLAQPVDVLAHFDEMRERLPCVGRNPALWERHEAARAAVAELVEAAKCARAALKQFDHVPSCDGAARQLDAALAALGGAK